MLNWPLNLAQPPGDGVIEARCSSAGRNAAQNLPLGRGRSHVIPEDSKDSDSKAVGPKDHTIQAFLGYLEP